MQQLVLFLRIQRGEKSFLTLKKKLRPVFIRPGILDPFSPSFPHVVFNLPHFLSEIRLTVRFCRFFGLKRLCTFSFFRANFVGNSMNRKSVFSAFQWYLQIFCTTIFAHLNFQKTHWKSTIDFCSNYFIKEKRIYTMNEYSYNIKVS